MKDVDDDKGSKEDAVDIDTNSPEHKKRRASASLVQLDATLFLDALMDAMESGKRPHVDAALRAVKTFVDGAMTLACDSTVTGVTDEDAADARSAVAAAEAALEAEKA